MIIVKTQDAEDISRLVEIDRSGHVTLLYSQDGENIIEEEADFEGSSWALEGTGEHSVGGFINDLKPHLERGAVLLGASEMYVSSTPSGPAVGFYTSHEGMGTVTY